MHGHSPRVPDKFLRHGVNKEFHQIKFSLLPPNQYLLFIFSLWGNVADLVGFLTKMPHLTNHRQIR